MSTETIVASNKTSAAVKSKAAPKGKAAGATAAPPAATAEKKTAKSKAAPQSKPAAATTEAETQPPPPTTATTTTTPTPMIEGEDGAAAESAGAGAGADKKKKKKQEPTHDYRSAVRKHVVRELKVLQEEDPKTYGQIGQISITAATMRVLCDSTNALIETLNERIHDFFRANPTRQTVQQLEMWAAIREIMRPPVSQLLETLAEADDEVPEDETNLHESVRAAGERAISLYNASLEKDASTKSAVPAGTKKPPTRMRDRIQTMVAYGKVDKRIRSEHSGTRLQPLAGVCATAFIDECLRFLVRCTLVRTIVSIRKKGAGSYILPKHVAQAVRRNRYLHVVFGGLIIHQGGVDHAAPRRRGANQDEKKTAKRGAALLGRRRRPEAAAGSGASAPGTTTTTSSANKRQKATAAAAAPASRPKAKAKAQTRIGATADKRKKKKKPTASRKPAKGGDTVTATEEDDGAPAGAAGNSQNGQEVAAAAAAAEHEAENKGEAKRGGDEVAAQDGAATAAAAAGDHGAVAEEDAPLAGPEDTNGPRPKREPKAKAAPKRKTVK